MANGTIDFAQSNSSGSYIDGKIVWTSTADKDANKSDVTAKLYVRKGHTDMTLTAATTGSWSYELKVNGSSVSGMVQASVLEDWVLVAAKTVTGISHNSDGSKSITISGSVSAPSGTSYAGKTTSGSATADMDDIPRASTITSAAAVILGNKCSVKWTPASKSFRYKLKFSLGDWSDTTDAIHPNTTSAYTYTEYVIPLDVASEISSSRGTMNVSLVTYSDAAATKQVGSVSIETFRVTVPNNSSTRPSVMMDLSPVSTLPDAFAGLYIQGKTKVKAVLRATGKYDTEIAGYFVTIGSSAHSGSDVTSDYLTNYGDLKVVGYATDERGYTGSESETITVIPYSKPQILSAEDEEEVMAARCDAEGNLSDSGTYLKIKAKRSYSKVESGDTQHNFCKIRYRYKPEGASSYSSWATVLAGDSLGSDEVVTGALLGGVLAVDSTYLVQIQAIDDIGQHSYVTITVPTDKVYMHRDKVKRALSFGKYIEEENCIDIADDIKVKIRGEKWVSLGLADGVSESESNFGRGPAGTGCFYRVVNDNHVQVAFNCAFEYTGEAITVNAAAIPSKYRPSRNVYALAAIGGRAAARIFVNSSGLVRVDWVQALSSAEDTMESSVKWIDGYIDYFINT